MPETPSTLPKLSPEQRRAAVGQFERAKQVLKKGDYDYCLQLLLACCKIDPANLTYRQELRQTQRAKYQNSGTGQSLAYLRSMMSRFRMKRAMLRGKYLEALIQAELILMRNPWDLSTILLMSQAFEELGWPDHALWTLEQIRPTHPNDPKVNRPLARLYEKRGMFNQAIALWELVRKAAPGDIEAQSKGKDLAASQTIAKGRYEEVIKGTVSAPSAQAEAETDIEQPALGADGEGEPTPREERKPREDRNPREVAAGLERIKQNPKNANAYLQLANIYRKAEQLDKAKAILEQGLEPTANSFEITQELLDLDIEPFRQNLAIAEAAARKNPKDAELPQVRASIAREVNARELEYYRRRSDRYPTDMVARFEMGLRLLRTGQIDEAIKELQTVRNDPRHHGKALYHLGMCFKARNNWKLAQRNFEECLKHLGEGETALRKETMFYLAAGYAEAGDLERAIELGSDLANVDYNYKNIGTLIEEWQAKAAK